MLYRQVKITPSLQRLLTPFFVGIAMQLNAISICQMSQGMYLTPTTRSASCPGNRHFVKADGLLEAGHFKSLLPQN